MNYSIILSIILVFGAKQICSQNPTIDAYKQLNAILSNDYQKDFPPNLGENKSIEVQISLHVIDLDLDEKEKKLNADMYFRQLWTDPRLAYPSESEEYVLGGQTLLDSIWIPDTFFPSSQSVRTIKYPKPNLFVRILPNGTVFFSQRLQHTIHCEQINETFIQCYLEIESYAYSTKEIIYKLKSGRNSVGFNNKMNFLDEQYKFVNSTVHERVEQLSMGTYSRIEIHILFEKISERSATPVKEVTEESVNVNELVKEGQKVKKLFSNIKWELPSFPINQN